MEGDARSFRVALVTSELLNPLAGGLDALDVLQEGGWGVVQLPAADYPDVVAAPLIEQVAEQTEEFARNGYCLAIVGALAGLDEALGRHRVSELPRIEPSSAEELRAFLADLAE